MKILFFDTETTGLLGPELLAIDAQPQIIEFFGHVWDSETDEIVAEVDFLAKPNGPLDPIITKITGLKDSDLKLAAPFGVYADKVQGLTNKADAVVGHNLAFDIGIVNAEFSRLQRTFNWPKIKVCTVAETEHVMSYRLSLTALHEYLFDQPFSGAHRAREDVEALTKCWKELRSLELV